ncbi:PREDICTED: F-box/kelch-repeat protein At1g67480-like [Populus euphratica]|uniref:F-box/kelch-repeat protein At1g67480-like n=1 Tax=Populus euphratica TaxID=75702 RepID=A0AAJ6XSI3_POPEU|nr:PREDICTED: F-box/kelch-repeat protein At1g67480-like [Populus euphratica]XP_011013464.1 PREDICTED: F-box/kelch-repeat protein At1g67480-like [Populus euphratica]XP_011013466.1 PREDICTED: F-box/kelch-repeat protein At1g67480-like [Populus euphratica]XP_011013467.1 PREDICTED: F-box/kelch-repeat protein At1g67480-like [Populus euphratica]XP_011013468.1 PREDICTED: F-box/kelch-repeat protein At1g67480-like [Populus euphratica]XP_011013469.1 PREDICTED: F-box/kelch-repeat protein At1g67480-like [P
MPGFASKKGFLDTSMSFFTLITQDNPPVHSKSNPVVDSRVAHDIDGLIVPGLPDDVAKYCLALVPRRYLPAIGAVCKKWRSFLRSQEFITVRKLAGLLEEWLYVLTMDSERKESHWVVLDRLGHKRQLLPPMPGPTKAGFGVVVLNGKLLVMAGHSLIDGTGTASADVYEYDCCLNSWTKLSRMNVARYDFACAEVNGKVYAAGGYGMDGDSLSSVEMYDPDTNTWTMIESLRRPRWGCFACGFEGKLYVMGGRSTFSIGNSRSVDVYTPERHSWCEIKNGCVMVTAHAVLGKKLFCMEWKNQRKLAIFNPEDSSWKTVAVPLTGSTSIGFRFGILDGKLLLFSLREEPGYRTLLYDPDASPGSEWCTSEIKPSGCCLCSVTIKA